MDTIIDPHPSNNSHQQQLLNEIDKERIPVFETLISFGSMRVSIDDSSAEQSINRRHTAISELASVLIDFESKRELVYTNNQTLSTPPITTEEEKQGSTKRRRTTTSIVQITKETVDVLKNLHNLASEAFLCTQPFNDFGIRHWGITFLCEILFRLERRRKIKEQEEERLLNNQTQTLIDAGNEGLNGRLVQLDKEIDECQTEFHLKKSPTDFYADHSELWEKECKRQIAIVNYSSEELRLQRKRDLLVGTETSENQVMRRIQEFMTMNGNRNGVSVDDLSNMLGEMEMRRACALEAFCPPISHPTRIVTLSRELLMLERSIHALLLGDSPKQVYTVISSRGSGVLEKSLDAKELRKKLTAECSSNDRFARYYF